MPKDEGFNLDSPDGITQEDIDIMNREADELERIAKNAKSNAEIIEKAKESIKGLSFAQLNVIDKSLEDTGGTTTGVSGISPELLKTTIEEVLDSREQEEKRRKEIEKMLKRRIEESDGGKSIKDVLKNKKDINDINGAISGMRSNPFGFAKGKALGLLGKAGVWGIVAQFAVDMAQQAYDQVITEVKKQFGAGGAWDKRKLVEDVLNEYNSIEYLTRIKSGGVFFTADAGQDLRQGAARGANNTRDLRDGHVRFMQFHFNE